MAAEQSTRTVPRHGGWRPGAGRKRGTIETVQRTPPAVKEAFAAKYARRMEEECGPIIEACVTACKSGDQRVLLDTLNRFLGRPAMALELSGPGGAPFQVQAIRDDALSRLTDAQLDALASLHALLQPAPILDVVTPRAVSDEATAP